jgi:hypothetical protein
VQEPGPEHNRLTRQFLGALVVVIVGCLGLLASLVFLYPAHSAGLGIALTSTLVLSAVVVVAGAVTCIVLARRIGALNRASRRPPR